MELKTIIQSKSYAIAALVLAAIVILFLTFSAGMYVGFRKARFSYEWGENYQKNFAGPKTSILRGMWRDLGGKYFIDSHGAAGQIIKIDGPTIILKGRDNTEKSILVEEDATIMRFRDRIKPADIKPNDFIVAIGEPDSSGQIEAKFIRVLPAQATSAMPFWNTK